MINKKPEYCTFCWLFNFFLEKDDVCVFQETSVLNPGQSMIRYLEGDFCCVVECLEEKDNDTGFHTLNFTMVNCSKECDIVSIFSKSLWYKFINLKMATVEFEQVNTL